MGAVLFMRVKSGLDAPELERRLFERRPRFLAVGGQKLLRRAHHHEVRSVALGQPALRHHLRADC